MQTSIDIHDLIRRYGAVCVERDVAQDRIRELEAEVVHLRDQLAACQAARSGARKKGGG